MNKMWCPSIGGGQKMLYSLPIGLNCSMFIRDQFNCRPKKMVFHTERSLLDGSSLRNFLDLPFFVAPVAAGTANVFCWRTIFLEKDPIDHH